MFIFGHFEAFSQFQNDVEVYKTLIAWKEIVADTQTNWCNLRDVKKKFDKTVEFTSPYTVFGLRGGNYKIMTEINYKSKIVRVRLVVSKVDYETNSYNISSISRGI